MKGIICEMMVRKINHPERDSSLLVDFVLNYCIRLFALLFRFYHSNYPMLLAQAEVLVNFLTALSLKEEDYRIYVGVLIDRLRDN